MGATEAELLEAVVALQAPALDANTTAHREAMHRMEALPLEAGAAVLAEHPFLEAQRAKLHAVMGTARGISRVSHGVVAATMLYWAVHIGTEAIIHVELSR
jgi:hypothetical protein